MKKILLALMGVAILAALYEQSEPTPNIYVMAGAFAVFMYGMMRLSARTKSKSEQTNGDDL
jgi:arginine exporter protein ArgO